MCPHFASCVPPTGHSQNSSQRGLSQGSASRITYSLSPKSFTLIREKAQALAVVPKAPVLSPPTSPLSHYCSLHSSHTHLLPVSATQWDLRNVPSVQSALPQHLKGSLLHTLQISLKCHLLGDTFPITLLKIASPSAPRPSKPPCLLFSPHSINHYLVRGRKALVNKSSPQVDFINKVLFKHGGYMLFTYHQWLLSCY